MRNETAEFNEKTFSLQIKIAIFFALFLLCEENSTRSTFSSVVVYYRHLNLTRDTGSRFKGMFLKQNLILVQADEIHD